MDDKLQQLEALAKVVDNSYVSSEDFGASLVIIIEKLEEYKETSGNNLESTSKEIVEFIESKIVELESKLSKQDKSSSKAQNSLLEAISAFKEDVRTSIEKTREEIISQIPVFKETDLSTIQEQLDAIRESIPFVPDPESAEDIRNKLELLEGDERLDKKAIRGLEEFATLKDHQKLIDDLWQRTQFLINKSSDGNGSGGNWTPLGITTFTVGGIAAGTDLGTDTIPIEQTLWEAFYGDLAPTLTLTSSPTQGIKEFGDDITSILLMANTVKHSNPIAVVTFFRNGSLIATHDPADFPNGGTETYTDTTDITTTTTFFARATDNIKPTSQSNTLTFTYVYPFLYGVHSATHLTGAEVYALTPILQVKQNTLTTTSPTNQTYVFAYPAAYGSLVSILDKNGFETINAYDVYTVSVTGLDGTPQTYNVYQLKLITTQVNFNNTYKFT
jgi:hypothetical protein